MLSLQLCLCLLYWISFDKSMPWSIPTCTIVCTWGLHTWTNTMYDDRGYWWCVIDGLYKLLTTSRWARDLISSFGSTCVGKAEITKRSILVFARISSFASGLAHLTRVNHDSMKFGLFNESRACIIINDSSRDQDEIVPHKAYRHV